MNDDSESGQITYQMPDSNVFKALLFKVQMSIWSSMITLNGRASPNTSEQHQQHSHASGIRDALPENISNVQPRFVEG